jgi:hypothetical protein
VHGGVFGEQLGEVVSGKGFLEKFDFAVKVGGYHQAAIHESADQYGAGVRLDRQGLAQELATVAIGQIDIKDEHGKWLRMAHLASGCAVLLWLASGTAKYEGDSNLLLRAPATNRGWQSCEQ